MLLPGFRKETRMEKRSSILLVCLLLVPFPAVASNSTIFAMIGDFGTDTEKFEGRVAEMIYSWNPEFILTLGDNDYLGNWDMETYDRAVGKYYCRFMYPTHGGRTRDWQDVECASIAHPDGDTNFYPTPGNHDWSLIQEPDQQGWKGYQAYFEPLEGQTDYNSVGYYTFTRGGVNFYGLNSNCMCVQGDPPVGPPVSCDGTDKEDFIAWLNEQLAAPKSAGWNLIYFHHPLFNTGHHGDCDQMDFVWDLILANKRQNNTLVVAGHEHQYQRIMMAQEDSPNKVLFLIDGLSGGKRKMVWSARCCTNTITPPPDGTLEQAYCYIRRKGALKISVNDEAMDIEYYFQDTKSGPIQPVLLDRCQLTKDGAPACEWVVEQGVQDCLE